jgi:DivIVA domain-containing protein
MRHAGIIRHPTDGARHEIPLAAAGAAPAPAEPRTMSGRGQTLSAFVVQRTFTRVRRGYDPDEVDRHLERVQRWFVSSEAGQAIEHGRTALAAMEAEARSTLEGARMEADATLEGARRRADADVAAARKEADGIREAAAAEGRAEAERLVAAAREEAAAAAQEVRTAAEQELAEYVDRRRREADRLVDAARRERRGSS